MATQWWKFQGATGIHLLRVKALGTAQQEVWLDGTFLDAPPETTTFTGPGAVLMELQLQESGECALIVDGTLAQPYNPDSGMVESPAVAWWKFPLQGMGTHHVRVTNIGTQAQMVFLDGTPIDAPPGTMTFTGPAASLLDLREADGQWVLAVDNVVHHQINPTDDSSGQLYMWNFALPTGAHRLCVSNIGAAAQDILLDSVRIAAPPGTTTFTGPGGSLLELQRRGASWALMVDGVEASPSDQTGAASDAAWTFFAPHTGASHQMRVTNVGRTGQEVSIDGTVIPAPDGTTTFTGPGGALLELRPSGHAWSLFVDGVAVEDYNARSASTMAAAPAGAAGASQRPAVDTSGSLPQGVSYDSEAGVYKANIKVGGRFRFLGDFATPTEAHERYKAAKQELGI